MKEQIGREWGVYHDMRTQKQEMKAGQVGAGPSTDLRDRLGKVESGQVGARLREDTRATVPYEQAIVVEGHDSRHVSSLQALRAR